MDMIPEGWAIAPLKRIDDISRDDDPGILDAAAVGMAAVIANLCARGPCHHPTIRSAAFRGHFLTLQSTERSSADTNAIFGFVL